MQAKKIPSIYRLVAFGLGLALFPYLAQAEQAEPEVVCDEGVIIEPITMNFGEHTTGCGLDTGVDLDQFTFDGEAGTQVRILVDGTTNGFEPSLEVRDHTNTPVAQGGCMSFTITSCSFIVEFLIAESDTFRILLSETGIGQGGTYTLQLERLHPVIDAQSVAYDFPVSDRLDPATDMDFFAFEAAAGTEIRIAVDGKTNKLDPRVEIRDPMGVVVADADCNAIAITCSFLVDFFPEESGTYSLSLRELGADETGNYEFALQCLFGPCPTELPSARPVCDIQMSQDFYAIGEIVTADVIRLANPGPEPVAVEVKIWHDVEGGEPSVVDNRGSDGSLVLPAGFDQDFGPRPFDPPDTLTTVTHSLNCRLLDPVTGRPLALDLNEFIVE